MLAQVQTQSMVRPLLYCYLQCQTLYSNSVSGRSRGQSSAPLGGGNIKQFCAVQRPWCKSKCGPHLGLWGSDCICSEAAC